MFQAFVSIPHRFKTGKPRKIKPAQQERSAQSHLKLRLVSEDRYVFQSDSWQTPLISAFESRLELGNPGSLDGSGFQVAPNDGVGLPNLKSEK